MQKPGLLLPFFARLTTAAGSGKLRLIRVI